MKNIGIDLFVGIVSSCVNTIVGYPMDFIKTRMQLQQSKQGTLKSIINIIKMEGPQAFYRGVSIQLLNSVFAGSIYFTTYEQIRRQFEKYDNLPRNSYLPLYQTFLAGSMAGICSDLFAIPFEYTKIQSQKQEILIGTKVRGPLFILFDTVKKQGIRQIYKGSLLQIIRDFVGCGSFFLAHSETLHFFTPPGKSRNESSQTGIFIASIAAGFGYWVISYPLDIIKTRYQVDNQNTLNIIKQIYLQGGILQFYKGFKITVLRSIFVNIFQLYTYENLRRVCHKYG
ncbi:unnamed protein product [Paramecium sonneborni]|uniref:Mitochondrial carrier protein n=1 Tax=Paramecium sonneborni TaxID=65129 RepID=A0A8S1KRS8_9CILI|nr:unnamed protein product [Paramecium sonneborni]